MPQSLNPKYEKLARPYAQAAFEYAREKNELEQWKFFLEAAADAAKNREMLRLINNPEIGSSSILELFSDVLKSVLNAEKENFLRLIAQHDRFIALPEISNLFNESYAALEKISNIRVVTAVKVNDEFKHKLANTLSKRTQREVTLNCDVDPAILGGAIIHIGDRVIDGSVRGKLTRLLEFSLR